MLHLPLLPVSWDRVARAVERASERLVRSVDALRQAGIPYAIAGGHAVAARVARIDEAAVRNTPEVEILLRRGDFAAARSVLEKAGFVHRRVSMIGSSGTMDIFLDGPGAKVRDAVHILWAGEQVRPESPEPSPDVTPSESADGFSLIPLAGLVRMKLSSFRDKDRMHLRDLIDIGLVDNSWLDQLPALLAERLRELLENPE